MFKLKSLPFFVFVLLALKSISQPFVIDDSLFHANEGASFRTQANTSKEIMEQQLLSNQLRIFLFQNGFLSDDLKIDERVSLLVHLNSENKVVGFSHHFYGLKFIENTGFRTVHIDLAKRDSLVKLLKLDLVLPLFGKQLAFKRKYLGNHSHFIYWPMTTKSTPTNEQNLAEIMSNTRADTVKTLNLKNNRIKVLEKRAIKKFKNVSSISLADNELAYVPKWLTKLKKLESIDLSGNYLNAENVKIGRNRRLKTINFQNNGFMNLPKSLKKLKNLDNLLVGNNSLSGIDNYRFDKLKGLKSLNFYNANLSELPKYVYQCKKLEELDLYFNDINYLSAELGQLQSLKTLAVSYNGMWSLPEEIVELTKLNTLFAHHNELDRVPVLPQSIRELDIGYNKFNSFPENISHYLNLATIDFNQNNMEGTFDEDLLPPNLKNLFISSNPFFTLENRNEEAVKFVNELQKKGINVN